MDDEKNAGFEDIEDDISFESILAEVKSEAFISGEKRTPPDVLDEMVRRIVEEERYAAGLPPAPWTQEKHGGAGGGGAEDDEHDEPLQHVIKPARRPSAPYIPPRVNSDTRRFGKKQQEDEDDNIPDIFARISAEESGEEITTESVSDSELPSFEDYTYADYEPDSDIQRDVAAIIERETAAKENDEQPGFVNRVLDSFSRTSGARHSAGGKRVWEPSPETEPDYRDRARVLARRCNSLAPRTFAAGIVFIFMLLITILFERGVTLPFGIGQEVPAAAAVLLIMQLLVMMFAYDTLIYGAERLFSGAPSFDSLLLLTCLASLFDGIFTMLRGGARVMPYSSAAALALTFTLAGDRMYLQGLAATLKLAVPDRKPGQVPRPIVSEYRQDFGKTLIKRTSPPARGFYANLMQTDTCETAFRYLVPLVIVFAVVIAGCSALVHRDIAYTFPKTLAGILAGATVVQGALPFALPFLSAVITAKKRDIALAGAGGADDMFFSDGLCITDEDIYPPGTISIGKVQIINDAPPDKALALTASLIAAASGGELAHVFTNLLQKRGLSMIQVTNPTISDEGILCDIDGKKVMVGTSAFMKLYNVRIQDGLEQTGAIYAAENYSVIAMFPIEYTPLPAVQKALKMIMRRGVKCYLAVRDFNITPKMISNKFNISEDELEFMPIGSAYAIGDASQDGVGRTAAVMTRGGVDSYCEAVALGRRVKIVSLALTVIAVGSSILGALYMAITLWGGEWHAASAGRLTLFLAVSAILSLIAAAVGNASGGDK